MIPEDIAKAEPAQLRTLKNRNSVTTKVKSHGLYELKSGMFAKSTQVTTVTLTPSLGLHFTWPKNASLGLEELESSEPCLNLTRVARDSGDTPTVVEFFFE